MTDITAIMVNDLRKMTGVGMMECKKALVESDGDMDNAVDLLRKSGAAKAAKKLTREVHEGQLSILIDDNKKKAVIFSLLCETDFVSKGDDFQALVKKAQEIALDGNEENLKDALKTDIEKAVGKLGENINVGEFHLFELEDEGFFASYIHSNNKVGALVLLKGKNNEEAGKDIAMHITAMSPEKLSPSEFSNEEIAKEKEIYLSQIKDEKKPADILEKIIAGKLKKFTEEKSLLTQSFVKDPSMTIEKYLASKDPDLKIVKFQRICIG